MGHVPKNIILIMVDQMRSDCIGAYGNKFVRTPNLDLLCSKSTRFNRMYVANPICSPSRMSLFSGQTPSNHGVFTNGLLKKDDGRTLPHLLRKEGYQTASIGKIHFNPYSKQAADKSMESVAMWDENFKKNPDATNYFGFETVEFTLGHTAQKAHYYKWFLEQGGTDDLFEVKSFCPDECNDEVCGIRKMPSKLSSTAFVESRAVHFLKNTRQKAKPFFLSVSFPDPHHPFTSCADDFASWKDSDTQPYIGTPEDNKTRPAHYQQHFEGRWTRGGLQEPSHINGVPEHIAKERVRHSYAMIEAIDRSIGVLMEEITQQNLWDDTIVLFTADHGELLGDHGLWMKGPFFYEGLIKTPLIIYHPQLPAAVSPQLFSGIDVTPTLLSLLGIPIPSYIDGVSQEAALFQNELVRKICPIEYRNGYDCDVFAHAIVGEDYKYVLYETGEEEYIDLKNDPQEHCNMADNAEYKGAISSARKEMLLEILRNKPKGVPQFGHA